MSLHDDLLTAAAYLEGDGVSMEAAEADRIAFVLLRLAQDRRMLREASAWGALDTHEASAAVGIKSLAAPITWTALHDFAQEVARRTQIGEIGSAARADHAPASLPGTSNDQQEKQR